MADMNINIKSTFHVKGGGSAGRAGGSFSNVSAGGGDGGSMSSGIMPRIHAVLMSMNAKLGAIASKLGAETSSGPMRVGGGSTPVARGKGQAGGAGKKGGKGMGALAGAGVFGAILLILKKILENAEGVKALVQIIISPIQFLGDAFMMALLVLQDTGEYLQYYKDVWSGYFSAMKDKIFGIGSDIMSMYNWFSDGDFLATIKLGVSNISTTIFNTVAGLGNRVEGFLTGTAGLSDKIKSFLIGTDGLSDKVKGFLIGEEGLASKFKALITGTDGLVPKFESFLTGTDGLSDLIKSFLIGEDGLTGSIRRTIMGTDGLGNKMAGMLLGQNGLSSAIKEHLFGTDSLYTKIHDSLTSDTGLYGKLKDIFIGPDGVTGLLKGYLSELGGRLVTQFLKLPTQIGIALQKITKTVADAIDWNPLW